MFELISDSFRQAVNKLKTIDDEKALKNAVETLKKSLLKADVHFKVTKELLTLIENEVKAKGIGQKHFLDAIKNNLTQILTPENKVSEFRFSPENLTCVMMMGLQGGGKTTSTIKLANYLKLRKKKVLVAACDLQRLAAVEQLRQLCEANEIDLFSMQNASVQEVAQKALEHAQKSMYDVLIVDTAGRLAIDEKLMQELLEVKNIIKPFESFYVADAMSGQEGVKTAEIFNEKIGISGVILSKFDADTKGGVALGIAKLLKLPLKFVGIGEKVADFESFVPDRIVSRIMGEGDLATLIEKTSAVFNEKDAKVLSKKIKKGEFNFDDFLNQLESVKKLGNLGSLVGMIPGMSQVANKVKDLDLDSSKEMIHIKAMISSMTLKERQNPSLLNNSRKQRIAKGAGLDQMQVNRFLKQFDNASKIAKKLSKSGMKGLGGMLNQTNFPKI
ncbi:signal recognition particle protein [Campylobacter canadensis]|uniref:signal recognition particle protein n=1 Tax=Campylobacter canadensis TaxID=449520 RepID=UPI001CCA0D33|nr:signal recognition particle receptor subunit alpha [Campylobacter canadensis]MBZ7996378.1 signal recognition particle protein [Campylobacter canadensis]